MRKSRYPFYEKIIKNLNKEKLKNIDKEIERNNRLNKIIQYLFVALYLTNLTALIMLTIYGQAGYE